MRRRFPFAGIVFEEYNATVTLATGSTETLLPANEGLAYPLGTLDTFVTYGAPANLIETRQHGRAADVRPPDRPPRRLGHRRENGGLDPARQQAAGSRDPDLLKQLSGTAMDVFADALEALFADPNLAEGATWFPGGAVSGVPIRIVRRSPDRVERFGDSRALLGSLAIDVRRSDAPTLAEADTIEIGGMTFRVIAEPVADGLGITLAVELTTH